MTEFKGAEAVVSLGKNVEKKRIEKDYRHPELDNKLNEERTELEASLLKRALKYGVSVPELLEASETCLKMQRIDGEQLKKCMPDQQAIKKVGEEVGKLHGAGIIHGDLTTSNILRTDEDVYLIDFGLAYMSDRIEDRAVDIHVLQQVLNSSHPESSEESWNAFLKGYREFDGFSKVLDRLEEVRQRGRYK